ncbi:MAG TPA: fibronectin type III domain-containing protein [Cyclobacteriaceae bacterium]|nr:fibronectin type III domain-containing protein [Cyclobacteriaceae bacterium]HRJ83451.1 fibronectin type III domain-containing protein [Cyclobacteriaceae bacterium]
MEYSKINRSFWLVLLLGFFGACNDDDNPVQLTAPQLNDAQEITSSSFTISWLEVPGAAGYLLDIATDEDFDNKVDGYNRKEIEGLSETVDGLEPGTTYYIRVFAVQGELESLPSGVKQATTEEEEEG